MFKKILAVIAALVGVITGIFFFIAGTMYSAMGFGVPFARTDHPVTIFLVGVVCLVISGFISFAGIWLARSFWVGGRLESEFRKTPWLVRPDWKIQQIASSGLAFAQRYWLIAFAFSVVFGVALLVNIVKEDETTSIGYLALVPALLFVGAVALAVRAQLQQRRFGVSHLKFSPLPVLPGGVLKGTLLMSQELRQASEITVCFTCVKNVRRPSGNRVRYVPTTLWNDQRNFSAGQLQPSGVRLALPVQFSIPADTEETRIAMMGSTTWTLDVKAKLPGVDFQAKFEVPVFQTEREAEN
jgi:hypothetical protein